MNNNSNDTIVIKDEYCCSGLQNSIEATGQRGISIYLKKAASGIMFMIQSRGIALEDVGKIKPNSGPPDIKINIACDTGMQYCPWCGKRLSKLVKKHPAFFEELAEKHKGLEAVKDF